jgi:hypothetical protein
MRKFLETKKFFQKIFKKFQPLSPAERKILKFSSRRRQRKNGNFPAAAADREKRNDNFPAAAADCLRVF